MTRALAADGSDVVQWLATGRATGGLLNMTEQAETSRSGLARRRSRMWRFVSPVRRRLWTVVLVLLVAVSGGYAYLTSDARVRAVIEAELTRRLGRTVRVRRASFSLFGPIEIDGLEIASKLPGRRPELTARTIVLHHKPLALLSGGFQPTRVACLEPVITIEVDLAAAPTKKRPDRPEDRPPPARPPEFDLPPVVLRDGTLRVVYRQGASVETIETSLGAVLRPLPGKKYAVRADASFAGVRAIEATATVAAAGGNLEQLSVPIELVRRLLPRDLRQTVAEYGVTGTVNVTRRDGPDGRGGPFVVDLNGLAAVVPASEIPLHVDSLQGRIVVDNRTERIWGEQVSCLLRELGGARLTVSGSYDGFKPDSPCALKAELSGARLPDRLGKGRVEEMLLDVRKYYDPRGRFGAIVNFDREKKKENEGGKEEQERKKGRLYGHLAFGGDVSGRCLYFPYRLEQIRGRIDFTDDRITNIKLAGTHGEGSAEITGSVWDLTGYGLYKITVEGRNVEVDADLRVAIDKAVGEFVWRDLQPRGRANTTVVVTRTSHDEYERVNVVLDLDARAGITHAAFPYALDELRGKVVIDGKTVEIEGVTGVHGSTRCTVNGAVTKIDTPNPETDLEVDITNLAVDKAFLAAIGPDGADALRSLGAAGMVKSARAHVTVGPGDATDYLVTADLGGARLKPDLFALEMTDVTGRIEVTPRHVVMDKLAGRHGKARITAEGKIVLTGKTAGVERLAFTAKALALDNDLRSALPGDVRKAWGDLAPGGSVDIPAGTLWHKDPAKPGSLDYDIIVEPVDARVTYAGFPRRVTGLRGRIRAVPGRITLAGLRAVEGKTRIELDGTIAAGKISGARLALSAWGVPVDKQLIAAIAKVAPKGVKHIKPGGSVSVKLEKLDLGDLCPPEAVGAPARAASDPKAPQPWSTEGTVAFKDMSVDVGLGSKTLSGSFTGSGSGRGEMLEMNARLALDEVLIGARRITALRGQLIKRRDGTVLQIRDFDARSYGGKLAGKALIDVGDPIKYGISLQVHGIKLAEMAAAGALGAKNGKADKNGKDVRGLLSGRIEMLAVADDPTKRRGAGEIHITDANISKLPVLLELLHLVQLQLPGNTSFSGADVVYRLSGQTLILNEIYLESSVISFVGSGTLNLESNKLRLTFMGRKLGKLPRLRQLVGQAGVELFMQVTQQFVEIRTTGTLAKPKTQTVALPRLTSFKRVLRDILRPQPVEDDDP